MVKVTLVMKSGREIVFETEDLEVKKNLVDGITGISFTNLKRPQFLFLRLSDVDAVLYEPMEESK